MITTLKHKDLLDAGVHFGHLTRKWHPNMAPFIFMERNGIHIIDLNKTLLHLQEAAQALKHIARSGRKVLFVGTKKQTKNVVEQAAKDLGMPYVTERWLGGTLTNFSTIRKLLKKMTSFDKLMRDTAYKNMAKKEQLMIAREKAKLERLLQGIADVTRLPAALFIVDINREHIAVREAQKLGIPVFALVDTNVNPWLVDYPIPSNDDAARSVELIIKVLSGAIEEGLQERQQDKETTTQVTDTPQAARTQNTDQKVVQPSETTPTTNAITPTEPSAAPKASATDVDATQAPSSAKAPRKRVVKAAIDTQAKQETVAKPSTTATKIANTPTDIPQTKEETK